MKNKGFTLIELIMVITVLAIIVLIAVPAVTTIINNSKEEASEVQNKTIINAAKNYYASEEKSKDLVSLDANGRCVTIGTLQDNGFLPVSTDNTNCATGLYNPKTKECILADDGVKVTYSNNKYKYEFVTAARCN